MRAVWPMDARAAGLPMLPSLLPRRTRLRAPPCRFSADPHLFAPARTVPRCYAGARPGGAPHPASPPHRFAPPRCPAPPRLASPNQQSKNRGRLCSVTRCRCLAHTWQRRRQPTRPHRSTYRGHIIISGPFLQQSVSEDLINRVNQKQQNRIIFAEFQNSNWE